MKSKSQATNDNKLKLRASIEASRLSRLKLDDAFDLLRDYRKELDVSKGERKKYLDILVSMLDDRLENKMNSINNSVHGGEIGGGGGGYSCGSDVGGD
jgi:hypothetical protein